MGIYIRHGWYRYSRQIEGHTYYRSLKIHRGQESLLSERLAQVESEVLAFHFGLPYQRRPADIPLSEMVQKYLDAKAHKASLARDRQRLDLIVGFLKDPLLASITPKDMERLEQELLSRKLSTTTVNRYFEILRTMFRMALADGLMTDNPLRQHEYWVEDIKGRALTDKEIGAVIRVAPKAKTYVGPSFPDIILFALATGMRLGEIIGLRTEYIQGDIAVLPISTTKFRKKSPAGVKRTKTVPLTPLAIEIIRRQPPNPDGFVFTMGWRHANAVDRGMVEVRKLAGIPDLHFHMLRHTVSTRVAQSTDLATAKAILGHSDLKTTMRYTHPDGPRQRKALGRILAKIPGANGHETDNK